MSKLGDRARSTWGSSREGTVRTVRWMGGGITGALKGSRERARALAGRGDDGTDGAKPEAEQRRAEEPKTAQADAKPGQSEADGAPGLLERLRSAGRRPVLWVATGLLLAAWLGWTVHVWSENGSAAGVGVLISWPAVFAALALIAAPLIGAGVFAHRHRVVGADSRAAEGASADEPAAGGRSAKETGEAAEDSGEADADADDRTAADGTEEVAGDEEREPSGDEGSAEEAGESAGAGSSEGDTDRERTSA